MIYEPVNLTAEEILKRAGFTRNFKGYIGWAREINPPLRERLGKGRGTIIMTAREFKHLFSPSYNKDRDRLHALTHYGHINLHLDVVVGTEHEARPRAPSVRRAIKEFKDIDKLSSELSTGGGLTASPNDMIESEVLLKSNETQGTQ